MPGRPLTGASPKKGARFITEVAADNMRAWRLKRGLSQDELGRRMRALGTAWSQAAVSQVEQHGRDLTIEEVLRLALVLEVTIPDLLDPGADDGEASDVDLGETGEMHRLLAHALVRGELAPRLEWTDDRPVPGSLAWSGDRDRLLKIQRVILREAKEG